MNVIDHAILIPASPAFIWRYIGDISLNTKWQDDCTTISFLTTQREGRGTRWRYTTPKGTDIVVEITAWYDTLGYEYSVVDGGAFSENKGRIRLQEIAEGTLVQWTFNYEVDGLLGGFRNSIGLKRTLTNMIQDSLRNLYKYVQNETGGVSTHEAKAILKEAPDVEQRSNYKPRHPSRFNEDLPDESIIEPDYPSENPISYKVPEPPVADDDTKPNPVVQGTEEIPVIDNKLEEPSFLQSIPEPPVADDDTKPNAPIIEEVPLSDNEEVVDVSEPVITQELEESPTNLEETPESKEEEKSYEPNITTQKPDIRDTSTVSVFEIFGLQKPSETQEMAALSPQDLDAIEPIVTNPSKTTKSEAEDTTSDKESVDDFIAEDISEQPDEPELVTELEKKSVVITEPVILTPESTDDQASDSNIPEQNMESTTTSETKFVGLRLKWRQAVIKLRGH